MASIFLSYAREDRSCAERLARVLESAGHEVWWDRRLGGGEEFSAEIEVALERADVVLVAYYDYACPYCKASNPHLERLIQEDKGLRVVFKELPILGPDSAAAARVSLAAARAGKFAEFHDALWAAGRPSPETIQAAAKAAGINPDQVKGEDIEAELKRNFQIAGQLGATGTPLFVVGDRVTNSAVGYEQLKKAVADARKRS